MHHSTSPTHDIPSLRVPGTVQCGWRSKAGDDGEQRPRYQIIADDLIARTAALWRSRGQDPTAGKSMARLLPSTDIIARRYRVTATTAQFAQRAAATRLRLTGPHQEPQAGPSSNTDASSSSPNSGHRNILEDMRDRILTGDLIGRLPARGALAFQYGVSPEVMGRVLKKLTTQGLLVGDGRRGYRVTPYPATPTA